MNRFLLSVTIVTLVLITVHADDSSIYFGSDITSRDIDDMRVDDGAVINVNTNTAKTSKPVDVLQMNDNMIFLVSSDPNTPSHTGALDKELTIDDDLVNLMQVTENSSSTSFGPVKQDESAASKSEKKTNDSMSSKDKKYGGAPSDIKHMASNITYQGCYTNVNKALRLVYDGPDTTNVRCAAHCANRGYPMASTSKGTQCYCSYDLPIFKQNGYKCINSTDPTKEDSVCPKDKDAYITCPGGTCVPLLVGPDCNKPCAGVYDTFVDDECKDGYCCGDETGKFFTVASVGELNPVRQLSRRIAMNLSAEGGKLTTKLFSKAFELRNVLNVVLPVSWSSGPEYEQVKLNALLDAQYGQLGGYCDGTVVIANWWDSFNVQGWSYCASGTLITGFYRGSCDAVYCIENAQCAAPCAAFKPVSISTCQVVRFSFFGMALVGCPSNTFLHGLWRVGPTQNTPSQVQGYTSIEVIQQGYCCALRGDKSAGTYWQCGMANWWDSFDRNYGWNLVWHGHFITGLYKSACAQLHCLEAASTCTFRAMMNVPVTPVPIGGFTITVESPRAISDLNGDGHSDIIFMDLDKEKGVIYWGPSHLTVQYINLPAMAWKDDLQKAVYDGSLVASSDSAPGIQLSNLSRLNGVSVYMYPTPARPFKAENCIDGDTDLSPKSTTLCRANRSGLSFFRMQLKAPSYVDYVNMYVDSLIYFNLSKCFLIVRKAPTGATETVTLYGQSRVVPKFDYKVWMLGTPSENKSTSALFAEALLNNNQGGAMEPESAEEFIDKVGSEFLLKEDDPFGGVAPPANNYDMPKKTQNDIDNASKEGQKVGDKAESSARNPSSTTVLQTVQVKELDVDAVWVFCNSWDRVLQMSEIEVMGIPLDGSIGVGDVNGDKLADIVSFSPVGAYLMNYSNVFWNSSTKASISSATGNFVDPRTPTCISTSKNSRTSVEPKFLADLNNDSMADLVAFRKDGYDVSISQTDGTLKDVPSWSKDDFGKTQGFSGPVLVADVNNDGCADMIRMQSDPKDIDSSNFIFLRKSSCYGGFLESVPLGRFYGKGPHDFKAAPLFLADVSGDSFKDLCVIGHGTVRCMLNDGTGTGFGAEQTLMNYDGQMFINSIETPPFIWQPKPIEVSAVPTSAGKSSPTASQAPSTAPTYPPGVVAVKNADGTVSTYIFDKIYLLRVPGKDTVILDPRKISVDFSDVDIELVHGYKDKIWWTRQNTVVDRSFRRFTKEEYKKAYNQDAPTIVTSELALVKLEKAELDVPPTKSEPMTTNDIVLQNYSDAPQSMTKQFSKSTGRNIDMNIAIKLTMNIEGGVDLEPFGGGGEFIFALTVSLGLTFSPGWHSTTDEGFNVTLVVPPKKMFSARFFEETAPVTIIFKADYVAQGDVNLVVVRENKSVYSMIVHMDELLALEQRQFVTFGQLDPVARSQFKAQIFEITDDAPRQLDSNENLLYCGDAHERAGIVSFSPENGHAACDGGSAHINITKSEYKDSPILKSLHPSLQHLIQKERVKRRPIQYERLG